MNAVALLVFLLFALLFLRLVVIGNREHLAHWQTPWAAERELSIFLVLWPAMFYLDAMMDGDRTIEALLIAVGKGLIVAFATYGVFMLMYRVSQAHRPEAGRD